MNKDLKDLTDSMDSKNNTHSELENIIKHLKEEVQRLNFTINEQKSLIQDQNAKINGRENTNIPDDIPVLRELILTQGQEIAKKDKDIEILQKIIEDVSCELDKAENFETENEELIYTKKAIVQLTEENENLKNQNIILESELKELRNQSNLKNQESSNDSQELLDAKKIINKLTEENGINKADIESLKLKNEESKSKLEEILSSRDELKKELEESEKNVDQLTFNNEKMEEKINYLQQKLEETMKDEGQEKKDINPDINLNALQKQLQKSEEEILELKNILSSNISIIEDLQQKNFNIESKLIEESEIKEQKAIEYTKMIVEKEQELDQVNLKLHKMQNANKQLSDLIVNSKTKENIPSESPKARVSNETHYYDKIVPSTFFKMYNKLDKESKDYIIEQLINDLKATNRDLKINAIKILSYFKSKNVFDALINLKDDNDWIIKLYLIKSLENFMDTDIKSILKFLQKDNDTDVRKAATELLCKLHQD